MKKNIEKIFYNLKMENNMFYNITKHISFTFFSFLFIFFYIEIYFELFKNNIFFSKNLSHYNICKCQRILFHNYSFFLFLVSCTRQTSISQNNVYIIQWDIILNFIK